MKTKMLTTAICLLLGESFAFQLADGEWLKAIASHGIGGLVAAITLWFYRQREIQIEKDRQKERELYQQMLRDQAEKFEKTLEKLGVDFKQTVEDNTKAITLLGELVKESAPCPFKNEIPQQLAEIRTRQR